MPKFAEFLSLDFPCNLSKTIPLINTAPVVRRATFRYLNSRLHRSLCFCYYFHYPNRIFSILQLWSLPSPLSFFLVSTLLFAISGFLSLQSLSHSGRFPCPCELPEGFFSMFSLQIS